MKKSKKYTQMRGQMTQMWWIKVFTEYFTITFESYNIIKG